MNANEFWGEVIYNLKQACSSWEFWVSIIMGYLIASWVLR